MLPWGHLRVGLVGWSSPPTAAEPQSLCFSASSDTWVKSHDCNVQTGSTGAPDNVREAWLTNISHLLHHKFLQNISEVMIELKNTNLNSVRNPVCRKMSAYETVSWSFLRRSTSVNTPLSPPHLLLVLPPPTSSSGFPNREYSCCCCHLLFHSSNDVGWCFFSPPANIIYNGI